MNWWDDGLDVDALDALTAQIENPSAATKLALVVAFDPSSVWNTCVYRWAPWDMHVSELMDALDVADAEDVPAILLDPCWNLSWPVGRTFVVPMYHAIHRVSTVKLEL